MYHSWLFMTGDDPRSFTCSKITFLYSDTASRSWNARYNKCCWFRNWDNQSIGILSHYLQGLYTSQVTVVQDINHQQHEFLLAMLLWFAWFLVINIASYEKDQANNINKIILRSVYRSCPPISMVFVCRTCRMNAGGPGFWKDAND